jgi:hypothetical protein
MNNPFTKEFLKRAIYRYPVYFLPQALFNIIMGHGAIVGQEELQNFPAAFRITKPVGG